MPSRRLTRTATLVACTALMALSNSCHTRGGSSSGASGVECADLPTTDPTGGHRKRAAIKRELHAHAPDIERCYETALERDRTAGGRVLIKLAITDSGSVSSACVQQSSLHDEDALECMLDELRTAQFGPADGPVTIAYPLGFRPR
jgi:hypothetical protein